MSMTMTKMILTIMTIIWSRRMNRVAAATATIITVVMIAIVVVVNDQEEQQQQLDDYLIHHIHYHPTRHDMHLGMMNVVMVLLHLIVLYVQLYCHILPYLHIIKVLRRVVVHRNKTVVVNVVGWIMGIMMS